MKRVLLCLLSALLVLSLLAGCGAKKAPEAPPSGESQVATAEDMTTVEEVLEEGMTPVGGEELMDGTYDVVMKSSSSMFKVDHCQVQVENGKLTALLYMTSEAYAYLYAGTAEEAAAAAEADYLPLEPVSDGLAVFALPIEALDAEVPCAAFSVRKELWYDRTLLFRADSLPLEAFADGAVTRPESLGLADGTYTVEVTLSGGSGKASVASPARLTVADGTYTAEICWSSPNYDYMVVDGEKILPENTEGNSVFSIPVAAFDHPISVLADTTAMSQPHEIAYTLTFDAASVTPAS
jgi:predicted small lipoprotein YifL